MAETEELIELGWKLGFFGLVSNAVYTHSFQIVTFGLQTEFEVIPIAYPDGKSNTSGQKLPGAYLKDIGIPQRLWTHTPSQTLHTQGTSDCIQ